MNEASMNSKSQAASGEVIGPIDAGIDCQISVAARPNDVLVKSSAGTGPTFKILVNSRQKGNPVLKFIRNVPWEFDNITPDYELGRCACALYLSLKYHNRFPDYIHSRLKDLGKSYDLRILLLQVDTKQEDVSYELNQLARICILADCTLILAFSYEEAGRYLEVYKAYENKPATDIMGKADHDFLSQVTECLTSIKGINKTDVTTLLTNFKTLKGIINADIDSVSLCPGIGPIKAKRLHAAFSTTIMKQKINAIKRPAEHDCQTDQSSIPATSNVH